MCEPTTIMIAGMAMTAISGVMGAIGQAGKASAEAQAASNQAAYQARVAANNKTIADWKAQDAIKRAAIKEEGVRMKGGQVMGQQIAAFASQGTDIMGSPSDILGDTASSIELDALSVRSSGEREAYESKIAGLGYESQQGLLEQKAKYYSDAAQPDPFSMASSLIGTAGSVAGKWYQYKQFAGGSSHPDSGTQV